MSNIKQLFEQKDNEIKLLERKCSVLEEENQNLKNKLMEYEQNYSKKAHNNSYISSSQIPNKHNTSTTNDYRINNKVAESNLLISSFNKERENPNKSRSFITNDKEIEIPNSPNDINQIIRENQYIYSPTNYSMNSKNFESNDNRVEIKDFLLTVKSKVPADSFKDFIKYLKLLTQKNDNIDKNEIMYEVKRIFYNNNDLYDKFERIIINKK